MNKVRKTCRINFYNHEMIRAVSTAMFGGDYSKALNFILYKFRTNTPYATLMKLVQHKLEFDRGVRTIDTLNAVEQLQIFLKSIEN